MAMNRREFLKVGAATGGGLLLGFHVPWAGAAAKRTPRTGAEVNAWIVIHPDDTVVIRVARSEMGQGILTALPMLVAEELECDWSRVRAEYALPAENLRRNRVYGAMSTGGSRSVRESQEYLRKAGAVGRELLIAAAAKRWGVPAGECRAARSVVTHQPSGRTLRYGALAAEAATLPLPGDVPLKPPEQWTLIGKPVKRLDTPDKVSGRPIYGIDVEVPGMLHAAIAQCPVFGGQLKGFDANSVAAFKGVRKVVAVGSDAVAVVADSWWQAQSALKALKVEWDEGDHAGKDSASILAFLRTGLTASDVPVAKRVGDADAALGRAAKVVEAEYTAPFLAHATMEPQNCTAHVTANKVEIWVPSQNGEAALAAAAAAAEVDPSRVEVHKMQLGGGFGRRGAFHDFVRQAVLIARQVDRPVKLLWTREEDIQHDFFRPVSVVRFQGGLDAQGRLIALKARVVAHSILNFVRPEQVKNGLDMHSAAGIHDMPYEVPNLLVDVAMRNTHVPVGFWRAPSHCQNGFYLESFMDELALAAGQDPYQFRRQLLAEHPKERKVLDTAADKAGWGQPLPAGTGRGIAMMESYGTYCAQVAEVAVSEAGQLRVRRVVCALDPGYVVNPDTIQAQTESAVVYGLTAALYGEITIKNGRVEQSNFHDYPMLRINEMPRVEAYPVPSGGFWGGMGEPPLPPIAPAVCNAVFAAAGKRVRSLPLRRHDLKRA